LTAEQSAIFRSPTTGGKPVRSERERSSQPGFPPADAPGARRFRLTSLPFGRETCPSQLLNGREKWRGCALRERRAEDGATSTIACDRSRCPVLRFPAVVRRRPGPRYALELPVRPSVFPLCASVSLWFAGWSGGLCALGVFAVQNGCVCGLGVLGALVVKCAGDGACLVRQQRTE
jgi:hypothetical protein